MHILSAQTRTALSLKALKFQENTTDEIKIAINKIKHYCVANNIGFSAFYAESPIKTYKFNPSLTLSNKVWQKQHLPSVIATIIGLHTIAINEEKPIVEKQLKHQLIRSYVRANGTGRQYYSQCLNTSQFTRYDVFHALLPEASMKEDIKAWLTDVLLPGKHVDTSNESPVLTMSVPEDIPLKSLLSVNAPVTVAEAHEATDSEPKLSITKAVTDPEVVEVTFRLTGVLLKEIKKAAADCKMYLAEYCEAAAINWTRSYYSLGYARQEKEES